MSEGDATRLPKARGPDVARGHAPTRLGGEVSRSPDASFTPPDGYEDRGPLGRGGMGEVRRVRDLRFDRLVALKALAPELSRRDDALRRFEVEARITAGLQHPGIVAVHDRGTLADGRPWFTMKEIRGRTLRELLEEPPDPLRRRRLLDAFQRQCEAVAFAHARGVVHRDLKPSNLMVGEFGEVLVLDWGLARRVGDVGGAEEVGPFATPLGSGTQFGDVLGTPAYMAPEQARGRSVEVGAPADVFALGAVLLEILGGRARPRAPAVADAPAELVELAREALAESPAARPQDASTLAARLRDWLDGARRRDRAMEAVQRARAAAPAIDALLNQADDRRARAAAGLAQLPSYAPDEQRRPFWALQDEAAELDAAAAREETEWLQTIRGALELAPDLEAAHQLLADHHRRRLAAAEAAGDRPAALRSEALLKVHDRGAHAAFLTGIGALTLVTEPPAQVRLHRYEERDRRLQPRFLRELGPTPLLELPLERGSYLLELRAPGHRTIPYPVSIGRGEHWRCERPGGSGPHPVRLPRDDELGPDDCWIAGGWFTAGGDDKAAEPLKREQVWVDDLVMRRFPVTNAEYLDFLNDLVRRGREGDAVRFAPKLPRGSGGADDALAVDRDADGWFRARVHSPGRPKDSAPTWPVAGISHLAARAYCAWAATAAAPWRLPDELEWEKAARSVDARAYPWGGHAEAAWAAVLGTDTAVPSRRPVASHPLDVSPYGVRGLGGNVRDWCLGEWRHEGPPRPEGVLAPDPRIPDGSIVGIRGGCYATSPARAASRYGARPDQDFLLTGFRLARPG